MENKISLIIEAVNRADKALGDVNKYLKDGQVDTDKLNAKSQDLTATMGRLAASVVSVAAALAAIKAGVNYLATIETATLGIASAFMTGGQYIDATSKKALQADGALKAAQKDSKGIIQELQYANLQTIATLDELINAYSVTLPVALAKGFNRQQVKDFTVAMVQAAGAIGLPMNQLGEETRSLLTGAIDPRNSRIATVLGLRNEDINQYKGNAAGLFDYLMDKLSAYRVAGIEAQKTWAGLWSNTKDIALQALGQGVEPFFEAVKYELTEITNKIVTLDETTKTIKWNPEFTEGIREFKSFLTRIIADLYRIGMLADKVGAGLNRFSTLGGIIGGDAAFARNDAWRQRYMASEKALQDMAMRETGWKPVTAEVDKKMREAALKGKRISDQTQINVGNPDEGTQQLLRYYRELDKTDPIWQPKTPKNEEDAKLTSLKKRWMETFRDMQADEKKSAGDDPFGDKLIEVGKKAEALTEKFKQIAGSRIEIEKWREAKESEIIAEADKDQNEKNAKNADAYQKQIEATEKSIQKGLKETTEETKTELDRRKALREADINSRLADLDLLEKEGTAHRDTIGARIALTEEMAAAQQEYLAGLDKAKDPTAWYTQSNALNNTRRALADLRRELQGLNLGGALTISLTETGNELMDLFGNVQGAVKDAFAGMTEALTDFVMTGKGNFSDLANSIIRDMIRIQIQERVTGPLAKGAGAWLATFFGGGAPVDAGGVGSGVSVSGHHSGGMGNEPTFYRIVPNPDLLPRHHRGLGPGERYSVTTDEEMILTPGQQKRFLELGKSLNGDGMASTPTVVNNYSTTVPLTINALDSRSVSQTLAQHKEEIVGIVNLAYNKRGKRGPLGV